MIYSKFLIDRSVFDFFYRIDLLLIVEIVFETLKDGM